MHRLTALSILFCALPACVDHKAGPSGLLSLPPQDGDGDGYTADRDCDDGDASVHPGAVEICDRYGRDENCNGLSNEDDPGLDPESATLWFPDADGDGFGAAADPGVYACDVRSGMVEDHSDCDDTSDAVHPDATEVCDGLDNDCDSSTSEADSARFIASDGTITDVTADLTGTPSVPVDVTLASNGTLQICEGTWYVRLDVQADVTLRGTGADQVALSSSADGTVVDISGLGRSVAIEGLTVTGGVADGQSPIFDTTAGGGINCYDGSGSSTVRLSDVVVHDNDSIVGGGLSLFGCNATITNSVFSENTAWFGGGLHANWSTVVLDGVDVYRNEAWTLGGGLSADGSIGPTTVELTDSRVFENASDRGGGLYLRSVASASCLGATDIEAGVFANTTDDAGGGVYLHQTTVFESDTCDFGTPDGGNDNLPDDVRTDQNSRYTDFGDNASFQCDAASCE